MKPYAEGNPTGFGKKISEWPGGGSGCGHAGDTRRGQVWHAWLLATASVRDRRLLNPPAAPSWENSGLR